MGYLLLWWAWMAGALLLAILEVLAPGYIFLGFAIGAFVVSVLVALGLGAVGVFWLFVIFAILSLVAFMGLRKVFGLRGTEPKIWDTDINDQTR